MSESEAGFDPRKTTTNINTEKVTPWDPSKRSIITQEDGNIRVTRLDVNNPGKPEPMMIQQEHEIPAFDPNKTIDPNSVTQAIDTKDPRFIAAMDEYRRNEAHQEPVSITQRIKNFFKMGSK